MFCRPGPCRQRFQVGDFPPSTRRASENVVGVGQVSTAFHGWLTGGPDRAWRSQRAAVAADVIFFFFFRRFLILASWRHIKL